MLEKIGMIIMLVGVVLIIVGFALAALDSVL